MSIPEHQRKKTLRGRGSRLRPWGKAAANDRAAHREEVRPVVSVDHCIFDLLLELLAGPAELAEVARAVVVKHLMFINRQVF